MGWAAVTQYVAAGPPVVGLLPYVLVLGAYAPALRLRSLSLMAVVAVALFAGELLAVRSGWLVSRPPELFWWMTIVRVGIWLPLIVVLLAASPLRLRATRKILQALTADLRLAERELSDSHARLQRGNEELHEAVQRQTARLEERNRQLAVVNTLASTLATDVEDTRWLDRALLLVGRLTGAASVTGLVRTATEEAMDEDRREFTSVVVTGPSEPIPEWLIEEVATTGTARYSKGGVEPHKASAALPSQYAVVLLARSGRPCGALGVTMAGDGAWPDHDLELLRMVADELAAAIERRSLTLAASARQRRDAVLSEVVVLLDGSADTSAAITRAMRHVGDLLGAVLMAVVTPQGGSRATKVVARTVFGGHGDALDGSAGIIESMLLAAPGLVSDRMHALVLGDGGEGPVSATCRGLGVRSLMICPVVNRNGSHGAVVLMGDGSVRFGVGDREMVERLAQMLAHRVASDGLFRLQERRISELSGLTHIAEVIQSTGDAERLFAGFARGLRQLLPFTDLHIALLDGAGDTTGVASRYGADGTGTAVAAFGPEVAAHPWFSLRASMWYEASDSAWPEFCADSNHPLLVVPLRPKGQVLGVLAVAALAPPTADEVSLVAQAVGQLALALDSIALYRQATERAARIQVLGNLARIVASVVDLRDAFVAFAEEVRWLIPFDAAVLMRVDAARDSVQPFAACPEDGAHAARAMQIAGSVIAEAIESRQILTIRTDDVRYARYDWLAFGVEIPAAAEIALVPIVRGEECTALLLLAHSERTPYTSDETAAIEEVARLLAISIERVDLFRQAEHSARHDLLTGLPNYRYFQERLRDVRAGIRAPGSTALVMVDMDDLKLFNDTLGHAGGDQAILAVARAMREVCRAGDFVARVGGDEFVALLEGMDTPAAVAVAERLHHALRNGHPQIVDAPTAVRVSAGIASLPLDGETVEDLLQAADLAMYEAKFAGGGRTGVASDLPAGRRKGASTGRPDRVVETLVRAACTSASAAEREAIALAQRYAVGAAMRLGVPAHDAELLRMLVARQAAPGLADARHSQDGLLAARLLDGLSADWSVRAPESAAVGQFVVTAAVDLAWLQLAAPAGAGLALDAAIEQLRHTRNGALDETVARELDAVARGDGAAQGLRAA